MNKRYITEGREAPSDERRAFLRERMKALAAQHPSLPWLSPHSWLFTIRAPDQETAIDGVYNLIADQKKLADLHGALCFDVDEQGNEVGSLSDNGYFIGQPNTVEIVGEVVGVREIDLSAVKPVSSRC